MTDGDRLQRVREGILAEAEFQFSGSHAPELRSPLYERLARHVGAEPALVAMVAESPHGTVRSLLAAVHMLLLDGVEHALGQWYPTVGGTRAPDEDLAAAFDEFVARHRRHVVEAMGARGVQTNEVRRSATLLLALAVGAEVAGEPLSLIELGPSAGLNLLFDRYRYRFEPSGETVGAPASPVRITCELREGALQVPAMPIAIASRVGVDLYPVSVGDFAGVKWLRACIWGDHPDRLALFDTAMEVARQDPPRLVQGDMVEMLPALVDAAPAAATPLVFHTSAVNYLRRRDRQRLVEAITAASAARRILWLSGEGPGVLPGLPTPPDAAEKVGIPVVLTELRNGEARSELLALAGVQGSWIEWRRSPAA